MCEQHMERNILNAPENMYFVEASLGNTCSFPSLNLTPFVLHMENWNKKPSKTKVLLNNNIIWQVVLLSAVLRSKV